MIMISSYFIFSFTNFVLTKLPTLGILFSTAVKGVVVAKLVILGILFLTSFILALRVVLVAKLVIPGTLSPIFSILASYTSFLTTPFFSTSLSLLKSTGTGTNLSASHFIYLLKLLKSVGTFFSLSISNLPTLGFKLAKSTFSAHFDVSTPAVFFKSAFVA